MSELNFLHSNGNKVKLTTPDTLAANKTFKLPGADGTSGQFLKTDGSGALSFASVDTTPASGSIIKTQFYKTSNDAQSTFSSLTRIFFTTLNYTAVQSGSTIVYEATISGEFDSCLLYTSPSPRDLSTSRMPSSA